MEATILQWLKQEGDDITEAESIVEIATDKVDSEIPSLYTGKLKKILVQAGQVIAVGKPIAIIETVVGLPTHTFGIELANMGVSKQVTEVTMGQPAVNTSPTTAPLNAYWPAKSKTGRFYSPLARLIAQQEGMSLAELERVPGTGKNNRVTKADIFAYLQPTKESEKKIKTHEYSFPIHLMPGDEVIPMGRIRQLIADRMIASKHSAPHVTSFVEADVSNLVAWRERYKTAFAQKTGIKLTYTPLFIEAITRAIQDYPMINVAVMGSNIIKRKAIHIGLAVALADGNLIVPVVKHADQLSRIALAKQVHDLVCRARNNDLKPDDVADGTYTVSNIGSFKNLMGTPIIMQPQVAIMALGAIVQKPAVITTEQGNTVAIRERMYLSHSYDHRVVDGVLGGSFVSRVAYYLENFDLNAPLD